MDKGTKTIVGIVIAVVIVGGLYAALRKNTMAPASTGGDTMQKTAGDTYKVGVISSLTGDAASYGEPARNIYQMAADEINSQGGLNGKKLELVVEDGKCSGKDGANAMQKLANVDHVQVVIGGFCSSESLSAAPVAASSKVALFSAGSSSPDLTNISPYFSRNYPSDATQGSVLADLAYSKEGFKKVVFIQEQLDYPLGIYKAFSSKFQSLGGTVVKEEYPKDATDFRSQLTKLKAENPDALFIDSQTPAAAERILKQLKDLGWKPRLLVPDILIGSADTVKNFKDQLEGAIGAEFGTNSDNQKFQHLSQAYKDKYKTDLPFQSYGQTEYDAVYMVRDAIAAVGYDGTKISEWLRSVKDWDGASGKVSIGSNGDRVGGHQPEIIKTGKVVPYVK